MTHNVKECLSVALAVFLLVFVALSLASLTDTPHAKEIRLVGWCQGKLMAAMEEDEFPKGCDWIEGVNLQSDK